MSIVTSSGGNFGNDLSPGVRVCGGRYLLRRLIGRGEFSEVWLARDIRNSRDIALKFLPRAFLQDENLLEFFRQEVLRQTLLKHPHIVVIHELAHDQDCLGIAMEFIDGWSLATLKVDKPDRRDGVKEIQPWVRELCDALTYAHNEFGIIHGDLKPSNLLLSGGAGVKVSDFGFAAHIRNESSKRGIIKGGYGGIGFLSPQQVMGQPLAKADDIYSLGATIFDLLTGTPPFYKGEIVAQIVSLKPPRMARRLAELGIKHEPISLVWEETVAACLAKNPPDRPQSVEEMLRLLERPETELTPDQSTPGVEIATTPAEETPETVEPTPLAANRPKRQSLTLFVGAIAVACLIAGLLAVIWLVREGKFTALLPAGQIRAGSLDRRFDPGTGADDSVRCVALLPGGKILIGGVFMNYSGVPDHRIARLLPDGALDKTFASHLSGTVSAIVPLGNGKVLIGGERLISHHPGRKVARLNLDGSFDRSFHGESYDRDVMAMAVQADGKVLVGGRFMNVAGKKHWGLIRLTANGRFDDSFNVGDGSSAAVNALAVQPDGKILAGGEFNKFNGRAAGHLVRLDPDGGFDPGFNDGTGADGNIDCILLQKDGKILICGGFSHVNDSPGPHIARLNADGSLDADFHVPDGLGNELTCMAEQADGKIVVGGSAKANGAAKPVLVRLNADGSLDKSFQITGATGNTIWQLANQSDGKTLVVGRFKSLDGVLCGNIARLRN
ncbi:MAG: protein kinase domain-containing protein [Limisphaerales bacterium]